MASNYKLLVIDIDGTLVANTSDISAENRAAVSEARRAGIHVGLCTGRSIVSCREMIDELGLQDNYHIFFDGALVTRVEDQQPVHTEYLEPALVGALVEYAWQHDIDLQLSTPRRYFAERETWTTKTKREYFSIDTTIGSLSGIWEREKVIRADIVVREPGDQTKADGLRDCFEDRAQFTEGHSLKFPEVKFVNVVAPGMSKGKALEALSSQLDITVGEVMAIGDWLNDIPMITCAGLGVAMGNAHDEVKKAADYVTLNVEEHGLAQAVRKYLL